MKEKQRMGVAVDIVVLMGAVLFQSEGFHFSTFYLHEEKH